MSTQEREAAQARMKDLLALLASLPATDYTARLTQEAQALDSAIAAFHLEGIRFRIYNVDRMVSKSPTPMPHEIAEKVAEVRHHLEAAGFHTRSHQAPQ